MQNANTMPVTIATLLNKVIVDELLPAPESCINNGVDLIHVDSLKSYTNHKYELYTGDKLAAAGCKVEMSKAQLLRQQADTLTADPIKEVLQGSAQKSVSRQIPIGQALYNQYFEHQKKKEVEAILEKALAMYFEAHN